MAWSRAGFLASISDNDGTVRRWPAASPIALSLPSPPNWMALTRDGQTLACITRDLRKPTPPEAVVLDIKTQVKTKVMLPPYLTFLWAVSPDNLYLAAGNRTSVDPKADHLLQVFEPTTGHSIAALRKDSVAAS